MIVFLIGYSKIDDFIVATENCDPVSVHGALTESCSVAVVGSAVVRVGCVENFDTKGVCMSSRMCTKMFQNEHVRNNENAKEAQCSYS